MLIEKNFGAYTGCRIPGIVLTDKKTLLAYYECRKSSLSDWADIDIKVIRSEDFGNTWETVGFIYGEGNTLNNPVMIVNGAEIHFLYCKNYREIYHSVSTDDGKNFSVPVYVDLTDETKDFFYNVVAVGPGHGIVYKNRMIVPVWFAYNRDDEKAHHPSFISTLYSDDGGASWHVGEIPDINAISDPSESALAITADEKIMMSTRNENSDKKRAIFFSDTGIDNWTKPYFEDALEDPTCQGSMCDSDGRIFHINCASKTRRENLTVKISDDNFKTYEEISVDTPAGYSDIAVHGEDIFVFYERDISNDGLYFKKLKFTL